MFELLKRNKFIIGVVLVLLVLIITVAFLGKANAPSGGIVKTSSVGHVSDNATGDTTAESLNALTEKLHQVIHSNQQLQHSNTVLNKKNATIVRTIRDTVQQNVERALQQRGDSEHADVATLQQQLKTLQESLPHTQQKVASDAYPVDDLAQSSLAGHQVIHVYGNSLVAINESSGVSQGLLNHSVSLHQSNAFKVKSMLHPNADVGVSPQSFHKEKSRPYFTIPSGATLARSISMTALIGRVPVNGVVKSPYPFKMIIGNHNMAANGLYVKGIRGAIVQGYTVGDMSLSCVKGYITAITFIFPDGTISTSAIDADSNHNDLGFNNALGYISKPNGDPCFPGKFYTNAPKFLSTMIALGALNQGGHAYAQSQQTAMNSPYGGTTSSLTGSISKYMLGGAVQGGTQQAMNWFAEREKNSFDAVYVGAG